MADGNMTDHDRQLIAQAEALSYSMWPQIDDMAGQADSDEAREQLHDIAVRKYHYEEYSSGIL